MLKNRRFLYQAPRMIAVAFLTVVLIIPICLIGSAESLDKIPYRNYTYWDGDNKQPVETKAVYEVINAYTGTDFGEEEFGALQHMVTDGEFLYVLDSSNGKIFILDRQYHAVKTISRFVYNGEAIDFQGAEGLFLDGDHIYVADTLHKRVLCTDGENVTYIITKPEDNAIPDTFDFAPFRLVKDASGNLYLLCRGSYYGMMVFSQKYEFLGFFGANNVTTGFFNAIKGFLQNLFNSDEKRAASKQKLPYAMNDICIDSEGFVVVANDTTTGQIKRYGLSGTNIMKKADHFNATNTDSFNFADSPVMYKDKTALYAAYVKCQLTVVSADQKGFYYAIDTINGRIYVYDTKANLLSIFGGNTDQENQIGTFQSPSSICVFGNDLLVSDFATGRITVFRETEYGKLLKKADTLTNASRYEEAEVYWQQVNGADKNCQLAYKGLAKAALKKGDYKAAMQYAKTGADRVTYAEAFEVVRNDFIHRHFLWIFIVCILLIAGLIAFIIISKHQKIRIIKNEKVRIAFQTTLHPIICFKEIKFKNKGSVVLATCWMLAFYISTVAAKLHSGFMFGIRDLSMFNSVLTLIGTVGIVLLWTVSNWLVCVLFEGKGKLKEIYCTSCYCLFPLILYNGFYIVLSNVLIPEATSPFALLSDFCYLVTAVLLLIAITVVHDFSFFKAIGTALATVFSMAIVACVLFAMLTLWVNLAGWILGLYYEATLR